MDDSPSPSLHDPLYASATAFDSQSLHGKAAIVTGSSRGIGAAIARRLAALGARVVVNYSQDQQGAEGVVAAIHADSRPLPASASSSQPAHTADGPPASPSKAMDTDSTPPSEGGVRAIAVRADAGTIAGGQTLIGAALAAFGRIDILVLNAGLAGTARAGTDETLADTEEDAFDRAFALHVKGPLFLAKGCAEVMGEGGRIIFLSHLATRKSTILPSYVLVAATRGASEQLSRTLAKELAPRGITVNTITPGLVDTPGMRAMYSSHKISFLAGIHPGGRLGTPADIAALCGWLCGRAAGFVSGQCIQANGALVV